MFRCYSVAEESFEITKRGKWEVGSGRKRERKTTAWSFSTRRILHAKAMKRLEIFGQIKTNYKRREDDRMMANITYQKVRHSSRGEGNGGRKTHFAERGRNIGSISKYITASFTIYEMTMLMMMMMIE